MGVVQDDMLWTVLAVSDMCAPVDDEIRADMVEVEFHGQIVSESTHYLLNIA